MKSVSTVAASLAALSLALASSFSCVARAEEGAQSGVIISAPVGKAGVVVPLTVTTYSYIIITSSTTAIPVPPPNTPPYLFWSPYLFSYKRHFDNGKSDSRGGKCNVHVSLRAVPGGTILPDPVTFAAGDLQSTLTAHGEAAAHLTVPPEAIAFITMGAGVPLNIDLVAKTEDKKDTKTGIYPLPPFSLGKVDSGGTLSYDYEPDGGAANVSSSGGIN